jgi:hypothetical protein
MPNGDLVDSKRYETQRPDAATSKAWDDGSVEKLFEAQNLAKTKLKEIVRRGVPDGIRSTYSKIMEGEGIPSRPFWIRG